MGEAFTFEVGPGAACDLDALVDSRLLVQANSGGGKSWCVRRLLEQTFGKVQHLVIDPEGEFSSLREKFDYVLAAPRGGDTVAEPRFAKLLATRLLELNASAILDIYELKAHDRIRFVRYFLEALVDAPKSLWHPALVIIDEAHVYCPQKGDAESSGAVIDLSTRGRKRGFCAVLATQRLSKLHKDAAAECNNKLIGRTGLDVDMKRAAEELGFSGREDTLALRDLEPGEFFCFGPALTRSVAKVKVGEVVTDHPQAGARLSFTAPPPSNRVRALLPKLADLPAEAEQERKSLEDVKKENADLKRQLTAAKKNGAAPDETIIERRVATATMILDRQHAAALKGKDQHQANLEKVVRTAAQNIIKTGEMLASAVNGTAPTGADRADVVTPPKPSRREQGHAEGVAPATTLAGAPRAPSAAPVRDVPLEGIDSSEARVLNAIAWMESIGVDEPPQHAVSFLSGYSWGGGFFKPRGGLKSKGLVEYRAGNRIAMTPAGRVLADSPDEALSLDDLHRRVLEKLETPERRVLAPLLEAYPEAIEQQALCEMAGYTWGGGYFKPRGQLKSWGLAEYVEDGVRATPVLFPEGLA